MHLWFRDILMFKATQDANRLVFLDELMTIKRQASKYGFESLGRILDAFYTLQDRLNANVNFDTAMQLLFLNKSVLGQVHHFIIHEFGRGGQCCRHA